MSNQQQYANDHPATIEELRALSSEGWESHDFDETKSILDNDLTPGSRCHWGELAAVRINSKSPDELASYLLGLSNEEGDLIMDCLEAAERSLEMRLRLVKCAHARILVAGSKLEAA